MMMMMILMMMMIAIVVVGITIDVAGLQQGRGEHVHHALSRGALAVDVEVPPVGHELGDASCVVLGRHEGERLRVRLPAVGRVVDSELEWNARRSVMMMPRVGEGEEDDGGEKGEERGGEDGVHEGRSGNSSSCRGRP